MIEIVNEFITLSLSLNNAWVLNSCLSRLLQVLRESRVSIIFCTSMDRPLEKGWVSLAYRLIIRSLVVNVESLAKPLG